MRYLIFSKMIGRNWMMVSFLISFIHIHSLILGVTRVLYNVEVEILREELLQNYTNKIQQKY